MIARLAALLASLAILGTSAPAPAAAAPHERAVLAGGCFWGDGSRLSNRSAGSATWSPFFGAATAMSAHYEVVSTGMTGHAESVEITYDPAQILVRATARRVFQSRTTRPN